MKRKLEEYEQYVSEIKEKKQKDVNFLEKGHVYLTAKKAEIDLKTKSLATINTGIKESVGSLKPEALAAIPVDSEVALTSALLAVYDVLYGKATPFVWVNFREKALLTDNGEDFIFRLLSVDYKQITVSQYEELLKVKTDSKFDDLAVKAPYATDLIHLAEWIDYVCFGKQFSDEKRGLESEYDKIKADIEERSDGSLEMSEKFWTSSLAELDSAQHNLINYQSELQTLLSRVNRY